MTLDIHDSNRAYQKAEERIRNDPHVSPKNRDLLFAYRDACILHQTCGKRRLIRTYESMRVFARLLKKDFDTTTRQDLESAFATLLRQEPAYSPETIKTHKGVVKRFFAWLAKPAEFPHILDAPETVRWLRVHIRPHERKRLQRKDILTIEEIHRLLAVCRNPRDRALISLLWETGARISEIGNPSIGHLTKTNQGYLLDLDGKTGRRTVLIVWSAPALVTWLNHHPHRNNKDAPLWTKHPIEQQHEQLPYASIKALLRRHVQSAKITKRVHPHLFRHSRATYVLARGIMTEAQAKVYFGWTAGSDMLSTYSHLTDHDANNAILKENKLTPARNDGETTAITICARCHELNTTNSTACTTCAAQLTTNDQIPDELFERIYKRLVEEGHVAQAVKSIHEAGLAPQLRRLTGQVGEVRHDSA